MLFTKKAINAALPSILYLRKRYLYHDQLGLVPAHASRIKHAIFYDREGKVDSWLSGYGDAMPRDLYNGNYSGADAVDIISNWMKGQLTREETISEIQARILDEE